MRSLRIAAAAGAALATLSLAGCGASSSSTTTDAGSRFRGSVWAGGQPAPDFVLRDQAGRTVRLSDERGRFVIVAFLYTHCPDVCPLIAAQLNEVLHRLGRARGSVRVLAVSVDPRGDTPAAVRAFVRSHRLLPQFRYLVGSRRALARSWRAYHVDVEPARLDSVDHSAYELLVDRAGRARLVYTTTIEAADVVHDLRALGLTG